MTLLNGGQCDVLALDFSTAFDKVLHACIYNYIPETTSLWEARGSILSRLQVFLTDKFQYVLRDIMKSYAISVHLGVPQGTALAPSLHVPIMYIAK